MRGDPWDGATRGRGWRQWRTEHREALLDGITYIATHGYATLFVWLALAVALSVPALLLILERSLTEELGDRAARLGVQVYLETGIGSEQRAALLATLRALPDVSTLEVVDPDAAIAELSAVLGVDVLAALGGDNPIPTSVLVYLHPGAGIEAERRLLTRLERLDGVEDVATNWQWRERLQALTSLLGLLAWMLGLMLGIGAVMVANATVRMAIESRLDELRVFALLGAERARLRRPFAYLGLLYGAGGGLLAAMLLSAELLVLERRIDALAQTYRSSFVLSGFDLEFVAVLMLAAMVLGLSGAQSAVRGALRRGWQPVDW